MDAPPMPPPVGQSPGPRVPREAAVSLALLLTVNLFNYIDRSVLAAVLSPIQEEFFAEDNEHARFWMGSLTSAFLVSYMLAAPLFGWMGDRSRRWALIGIGVIVWSLASGGSGLATTFAVLFATRMLVGIGEAAYGPTAPTIIADLFPVARRGGVLAWFYMAIPVGTALGYVLGGQLAHHLGWRWAFYAVVPPGILLGILCFLRREPLRGEADALVQPVLAAPATPPAAAGLADRTRARFAGLRALLHNRSYVLNTAGMTAMTFALGGLAAWMPHYLYKVRGVGALDRVTLIFGAIVVVAGFTGTLAGGYTADALRRRWPGSYFLVSGLGMLVGCPLFVLTLFLPFPAAWWTMFAAVFCLMFNTGPTNTIIANVTAPAIRSTAFAFTILVIHALGDVISPPLIGAVADAFQRGAEEDARSFNIAFLLVGGAFLVGGICWLAGARYLAGDTAAALARSATPPARA